jgi:hypothetical protein
MLATPRKRRERPLKKFPQILAAVLLLLYALFFAWRIWACLTYPYPVEYGEGAVLYEAAHLAQGQTLYTTNIAPPYQAVVYGPLYYYLNALPLLLNPNSASFGWGRLFSVLAALGAGFCIYRVVRHSTNAGVAWAAALTPFATEPVFAWGTLLKPDMLATLLSLTAISLLSLASPNNDTSTAQSSKNTNQNWTLYVAAFLCVLAFFIKQSAFAAPLTVFLWLVLTTPRRALSFIAAFGGGSLLVLLFFQLTTQGQFLTHFVSYNGQPYQLDWLLTALGYLLQTYPVLLLLSLVYIFQPTRTKSETPSSDIKNIKKLSPIWKIYWVAALVVTFSVGKVGSNLNYYLELMFISSVLSWQLLYQWWEQRPRLRLGQKFSLPLAATGFLLLAFQLVLLHHIPVVADGANTPNPVTTEQSQQIKAAIAEFAPNGPLLVEDAGWLPPLGLTTDLDDSFVFGQLAQGGQWDQTHLLQDLQAGYYKTVMLETIVDTEAKDTEATKEAKLEQLVATNQYQPFPGRFSPAMLQIFHAHFNVTKRIGTTLFLIWHA